MKRFIRKNKYLCVILVILLLFTSCGKEKGKEKIDIKVYVTTNDKVAIDLYKKAFDGYKEKRKGVSFEVINSKNANEINEEEIEKSKIDMIITSKSSIISLNQKGYIENLSFLTEKIDLNNKYYNSFTSYGMIGDKYYGYGILPYTIELVYNMEAVKNKGWDKTPIDINNIKSIQDKLKDKSTNIPVLLQDDLKITHILSHMIFTGMNLGEELEKNTTYDMKKYENMPMDQLFLQLKEIYKSIGGDEIFTEATRETVKEVKEGKYPVIISSSYYVKNIDEAGLKIADREDVNGTIPVILDGLVCCSASSKNKDEIYSFIEYMLSNDFQTTLRKEGYVTGNKEINKELSDNEKIIEKHLKDSSQKNILFLYKYPDKIKSSVWKVIEDIESEKNIQWKKMLEKTK